MPPVTAPLSRRRFLSLAAPAAGIVALPHLPGAWAAPSSAGDNPFTLGVASGDARSTSVVLWTRLARRPLQPDGGMGDAPVRVEWKVFTWDGRTVVDSGAVYAKPAAAHSVHVVARGLEPGRWYRYRFRAAGFVSPGGHTRTLPDPTSMPSVMRFAMVSCQNYEAGFYTAYRHLAEENLDYVMHLGDYIYETSRSTDQQPRYHLGGETRTLADYRVRHAQYRTDPDLQLAHRRFPWMVTFDDHEVDNNWTSELNRTRRAAALQAYYEHMPLRPSSMPLGPDMAIYRRLNYGRLARISLLDTRQYRSAHACRVDPDKPWAAVCDKALDTNRTMTGPEQERWLLRGLNQTARWNVIAQQVLMARWQRIDREGPVFNLDAWDGYPAARARILGHVAVNKPRNPLVLTGDAHVSALSHLKQDFTNPLSPTIATEIITTSITSGANGAEGDLTARQALDPHVQFLNRRRGYVRNIVTPQQWRADFRAVPYVKQRGAPITTKSSWVIRDGVAGAEEVAT